MKLSDLPKPFIIADIGSNWKRGDNLVLHTELARRHIYDAALCGVSAVKFQFFTHRELYGFDGPSPFALPPTWLPELAAHAAECGVQFMCSAFSPAGVALVNPWVNIHKIASCEMKHLGILDAVINTGKPFLISTGAAHQDEIEFIRQYIEGKSPHGEFTFLECVASYPAKSADYRITQGMGVSDHTNGHALALIYAGAGGGIFEKHFDALKDLGAPATPDTAASAGPKDLGEYCRSLKEAFEILKDKPKCFRESEQDIVSRSRRRLKIIKAVNIGDTLHLEENFGPYRSITIDNRAAAPELAKDFDGKKVKRAMKVGEGLWWEDVE